MLALCGAGDAGDSASGCPSDLLGDGERRLSLGQRCRASSPPPSPNGGIVRLGAAISPLPGGREPAANRKQPRGVFRCMGSAIELCGLHGGS